VLFALLAVLGVAVVLVVGGLCLFVPHQARADGPGPQRPATPRVPTPRVPSPVVPRPVVPRPGAPARATRVRAGRPVAQPSRRPRPDTDGPR